MKYQDGFVATFHKKVSVTLFEKYAEAWYFFFSKGLTKQESQRKACSSWETSSLEERQQLIQKHITTYQQKHGKNTLFSFAFSRSGRKTAQMHDINISSSLISSSSASYKPILKKPKTSGCEQRKEYIDAHKKSVVHLFLTMLKVETDKFLNEHALKEEFLMKSLKEISLVYLQVEKKLLHYEQGKICSCKSVLANNIVNFYELKDDLVKPFKSSLDTEVNSLLGLSLLMKTLAIFKKFTRK